MPLSRILARAAATAAVALLAACTPEQIDKLLTSVQPAVLPVHGSVRGLVVDGNDGKPVANAVVAVGTSAARAVSGADGSYEVRGLAAGTHFVKGEADGFLTFFGEVRVADGPTFFEIRLRRPAGAEPVASPSPVPVPTPAAVVPSDVPAAPVSDAGSAPDSDSVAAPASDVLAGPASDAASVPHSDVAAAPDVIEPVDAE